jgi:CubicO group peptidase (beta-lactamase class C family)
MSFRAIALVGCVAIATASVDAQRPGETAAIAAFIEQAMTRELSPGLGVGIVVGDRLVFARGFGFANREQRRRVTADTQFYIASTTKAFTALTGAQLAARGLIDLDAPISKYLTRAKTHPEVDPQSITVRSLLTHTHGIRAGGPIDIRTAYTGDFTHPQLLQLLSFHGPAPNRQFAYSNVGYNIFGMILDETFNEGWKNIIEREVLRPIGMDSTTAFITKAKTDRLAMPYNVRGSAVERIPFAKSDANMQAAGGHVSTVNDLGRYLIAQLNAGRIGGRQVIPAAVIESTHVQQVPQKRRFGAFERFGWSLGWDMASYSGEIVLQRYGGFPGFYSHVSFMPQRKFGVVVLSNGGATGQGLAEIVAQHIYDRLLGNAAAATAIETLDEQVSMLRAALDKDRATRLARPQVTPLPLSAYAGTYEGPALGRLVLTFANGKLRAKMGIAESDVEVYDGGKYQLRVEVVGPAVLTFQVPAGADRPTSVRLGDWEFARASD